MEENKNNMKVKLMRQKKNCLYTEWSMNISRIVRCFGEKKSVWHRDFAVFVLYAICL